MGRRVPVLWLPLIGFLLATGLSGRTLCGVPTNMLWVVVPDRSVVTEPNRIGRTMVWPVYVDGYQDDGFHNGVWIRCFMPGSMT